VLEAQALAARCILQGIQTIVFGRSRLTTELLLTYLRESIHNTKYEIRNTKYDDNREDNSARQNQQSTIRGYRGGYLPSERRLIEAGLRSGEVQGVVATNALELGVDIGQLQAAILCGYPGSIASTWQQMGRAGRTQERAVAILVATGGVLDQYIIQHPEFLLARSPEHALINPDNLLLLLDQLRCAAFELPFDAEEHFGQSPFTADGLALLMEQGEVQRHGSRYFWIGASYPAQQVSLRSTGSTAVVIQVDQAIRDTGYEIRNTEADTARRGVIQNQTIGEIDVASAPLLVHTGAIYIHEGQSYQVEQLDLVNNLAHVRPVQVDYYTEVSSETEITVLAEHDSSQRSGGLVTTGDLQVSSQVTGYRRVRRFTHETLGLYPLTYPAQLLETSGYWVGILPETQARLAQAGQWFDSPNDYGPNWQEQRTRVRKRDGYRCVQCGAAEAPERQHDVHHLTPFRTFGYMAEVNENYKIANRLENLILVCRTCHQRLEGMVRVQTGLDGLAYVLYNLAPLYLMCAPQDLGVSVVRDTKYAPEGHPRNREYEIGEVQPEVVAGAKIENRKSKIPYMPTIYLYERVAAGLGFAARLYELHDDLLVAAQTLIEHCACPQGCPACVGPVLEQATVQLPTKRLTLTLLHALHTGTPPTVAHRGDLEVDCDNV
jgi:DEAD/DEAH box helicase domain-containing protein